MDCLRISQFDTWDNQIQQSDRLIADKLLQPARWDMIVYRPRHNRDASYVSRLLGLPGETIRFKDQALWIDGAKVELPETMRALEYHAAHSGQADRAWALGPDDFFVVGDFSSNSADSREFGPIPRSDITAVVTVIYWPPSR